MLWFLRLFRRFRDLEAAIDGRAVLEERLDGAQRECAWLRSQLEAALENERRAYRMQVNFDTQQRFGVVPYPDAPRLPERYNATEPPEPLAAPVIQGTRITQMAEDRFFRKVREMAGR